MSAPSPPQPPRYRPPPSRRRKARRAVVASLAGVAVAAVLMWLVVDYAAERPDQVNLGDDTFDVGNAERLAKRIAEQREPFLFKDPLTSKPGREVYVQHLGSDPEKGWIAIEAYAPDAPRELRCILDWQPATQRFADPCSDDGTTYPADGSGLRRYPVTVNDDDQVEVNLRASAA